MSFVETFNKSFIRFSTFKITCNLAKMVGDSFFNLKLSGRACHKLASLGANDDVIILLKILNPSWCDALVECITIEQITKG